MIVPLNIIRGYLVDWDFSKILRDLVQNFYDEIGYKNFAKEFMYEWQEVDGFINLSMRTKGHVKTESIFKFLSKLHGS